MGRNASLPAGGARRARTVRSVTNAVEILRCISRAHGQVGINEIARRVRLDKSSVSRLISTMEAEHLLERSANSATVRLGFGLIAITAPLLADIGLSSLVRPRFEQLAQLLGETVNLSIWDGREAVSIVQALGTNAITHYAVPGQRNPAHCTASGKVLLAYAPESEAEAILSGPLERYTDKTVTDPIVLRRQLEDIRATGDALNCGEFASDVGAVATVLRDTGDQVIGAITVTVPMYRFDDGRQMEILKAIKAAATELSEGLGHSKTPGALTS